MYVQTPQGCIAFLRPDAEYYWLPQAVVRKRSLWEKGVVIEEEGRGLGYWVWWREAHGERGGMGGGFIDIEQRAFEFMDIKQRAPF